MLYVDLSNILSDILLHNLGGAATNQQRDKNGKDEGEAVHGLPALERAGAWSLRVAANSLDGSFVVLSAMLISQLKSLSYASFARAVNKRNVPFR